MSHRIASVLVFLFGSVTVSLVAAQGVITVAPPRYAPPVTIDGSQKERMEKQTKIDDLQKKLQSDIDEAEEEKVTAELKEAVASLFDHELEQLKNRVAKMQDSIKKRSENRDKLVQDRFEKIMNAPKPGDTTFQVSNVEKQDDGSSVANVVFMRAEQRTREVPVTEIRKEKRTRTVNGEEQEYTVSVPVSVSRTQTYLIQIPLGQKRIPIPKGKDVDKTIEKFLDEENDF